MPDWQEVGARPGVQPADTGLQQRIASDAFAAPDALYEMLFQKVVSLGLTDELTQIQEKKALEDWKAWFDAQRLQDCSVEWTMTLVEASEGEMRLVPAATSPSMWGIRSTIEPYSTTPASTIPKLAGSCRGPKMTVKEFEKLLTGTESGLKRHEEYLAKYRREWYLRSNIPLAQESVRAWQQRVSYLRRLQRETEVYPVKVIARCDNEPRVLLVAWVGRGSKEALVKVAPKSEIALSGMIGEVVPYLSHDGVFVIEVVLDQCELPREVASPTPGKVDDADRKCREYLSMARNYIRAGMPEKAIPYLKQVIEQYGDTDYAKQARELEQEALRMMGGQSEGEDAPPAEGEPSPAPALQAPK
jgi:tetratricopeptide (TPR) repeat protein